LPIEEQEGACTAMRDDAEKLRMHDSRAERVLLEALVSLDRPPAELREHGAAIARADYLGWRDFDPIQLEAVIALGSGDFARAAELVDGFLEANPYDRALNSTAASLLVGSRLEAGEKEAARRAAETFRARRAPLQSSTSRPRLFEVNPRDATAEMLAAIRATGGGDAPFEAARGAWLEEVLNHWRTFEQRASREQRNAIWFEAYAEPAETPADARAALDAVARFSPLPELRPSTMANAAEGRVHLLAGDAARALPLLRRGAGACLALSYPIERMHARLDLGLALEALGNKGEACAAYASVLARWGTAKPRSVTAEAARTHAHDLGCAGVP
jgi:hypothetical protein